MSETKKCIACAEDILLDAKLCKHCSTMQDDRRFQPDSAEPKNDQTVKLGDLLAKSNDFVDRALAWASGDTQQTETPEEAEKTDKAPTPKLSLPLRIGLGVILAAFAAVWAFTTLGGGFPGTSNPQSPTIDPNGISVKQFGCTVGTSVASAIVESRLKESVNAFVSVGLYGSEGTLQHTAVGYQIVEPGGRSLINVPLDPYIYTAGDCRIINVGY